ncbi:hypothetical protein ACT8ZV_01670 [Nocardioides sp. MAHUQ-72]|uniref:hypothetical protein n=1 Tax=unclassified Nocardioides TaxID=2615069 RepID=UPI003617AD82
MRSLLPVLGCVLALGACSNPTKALQDQAACPGRTCTDDARDRYDAIAGLDRVTGVESVARTYGLDKGAASTATVQASVRDDRQARQVALDVLAELDAWPDHEPSTATATVRADPVVDTEYVGRQTEDLSNPYFKECSPAECEQALTDLRERMLAEIDGLRDVSVAVRGGTLRIEGTTDPEQYSLAAAAVHGMVLDTALRLADRLDVEMRSTGPLELTLRLREGRVCAQAPGTTAACDEENSRPFDNS